MPSLKYLLFSYVFPGVVPSTQLRRHSNAIQQKFSICCFSGVLGCTSLTRSAKKAAQQIAHLAIADKFEGEFLFFCSSTQCFMCHGFTQSKYRCTWMSNSCEVHMLLLSISWSAKWLPCFHYIKLFKTPVWWIDLLHWFASVLNH